MVVLLLAGQCATALVAGDFALAFDRDPPVWATAGILAAGARSRLILAADPPAVDAAASAYVQGIMGSFVGNLSAPDALRHGVGTWRSAAIDPCMIPISGRSPEMLTGFGRTIAPTIPSCRSRSGRDPSTVRGILPVRAGWAWSAPVNRWGLTRMRLPRADG